MSLLKSKYSTNKFLICLKSAKLPYQIHYQLYQVSIVDWLNVYIKILRTILSLREETSQTQCRLKHLINNYQSRISGKIKQKYTERFIYNYIKSYKNTLKYSINKKNQILRALKLQALTYIYLTYKVLQSKYPAYSYFLLVTKS